MIYMDHAATTPLCDKAKKVIFEHLNDYGNPSSQYELGRKSRLLIEDARESIAKCINAEPDEIYFTSGGSEANSWALNICGDVLISPIEHHSIRSTKYIVIDSSGIIDITKNKQLIKRYCRKHFGEVQAVSCMMVNNELGTIQPVSKIAEIAHENNLYFHTDAVQALGHIPVDVKSIGCDTLSASGHKFNALKGAGFLYIKKDSCNPYQLIYGGKQEQGLRGGTENVLGIISMATALKDSIEHMEERNRHIKNLRDRMLDKLLQIKGTHLNGSLECRNISNINIRFDGVSGSRLVVLCDLYGLCISSGSACNEGEAIPSHVLKAIGLTDKEALSSIRITLGHQNTIEEVDSAVNIITKLVARIREENE